ncbi:Acyl-CoA synthetase (AMP-forming)/AMP-acid ligase II [Verrucomicrobium sp. GAS474]|uniref:class I adenylate-forming enzyme family protein n=1 Tax=Verrucomicrobium sp. GAS474 TaxID=1882831 RepID=UPI00087D5F96|nr:class I adenylate-forming enzyme family protein [Verrucomicrobium sp. GAS474]SDU05221.1 Acyl-CoA synthetase (AMP-forming)/AMP-acid ligase II [Verrucomicrobium sp. GAS474]
MNANGSDQTPSALWTTWEKVVAAGPTRVAMIDAATGETWTRRELHRLALELSAGRLADVRGRRVALCHPNSAAWVASFLAIQKAGASAIPLDAGIPEQALESAAAKAGADWLDSRDLGLVKLRMRRSAAEACVKLTSGSTGMPKKIRCRAEHLLADGRQVTATMGIKADDRNLGLIPFAHSYGLGNLVLPLILQGTSIVFAAAFLPGQIPAWIAEHGVTLFPTVPPVLKMLAQLPGEVSLEPLRMAISAGAPLSPQIATQFAEKFGIRAHNFYGSSETGGICFDETGADSLEGGALGKPLRGVTVRILRNGRLRVESPAVATPSGSFLLTDLGEWTALGTIRLLGRASQVANLGGRKLRASEIETALRGVADVRDAWVGIGTRSGADFLAAVVETEMDERTLRQRLATVLPPWKVPRLFKCLPSLPRTERGKVDGAVLKKELGI